MRYSANAVLLLGVSMLLSGQIHAEADSAARVDALFAQWDKSSSPGCSVAVMKSGEIVYERGYGMADLDHGIANTPATVFHIASISKQFAAASIVLLAQDGKLSFDDPVRKYVPELPDFGTPITIRHLLHHVSGLRDQWELLELSGWRYSKDLITDDDVLSLVKHQKHLNFAPGERYSYSNTGFTLLAQVVRRVSGKSFREFTTERIFHPLGMNATHFRDDFTEIVPNMAYGYVRKDRGFRLSVTNFDTVGATSLLTTVVDLAKWDRNFLDGKVGGPGLLQQMIERGVLNDGKPIDYAFGLMIGTYRGLPTVGHSGSDAGYRAYLVRFPEQRFGIACLCNIGGISPTQISEKIADIYLADQMQPPQPSGVAVTMSEEQLTPFAGTYLRADGRAARRAFVRDGQLRVTSSEDENAVTITPLGGSRFRVGEGADRIELSGSALRVIPASTLGQAQTYERVPAYAPTAQQLAQYAGTYVSAEVELPYRLAVEDGALVVTSMKIVKPMRLAPFTRDLFVSGDLGTVSFTRDRRGKVSGFLVNTDRVVDFRFDRRP